MVKIDKKKKEKQLSIFICFSSACIDQSEKDRWLSKLDNSNWLLHVKETLTTACIIAQTIDCEGEILVFCNNNIESIFLFDRNIDTCSWK